MVHRQRRTALAVHDLGGANQTWRLVNVSNTGPGEWPNTADGFASINAMGVNGTTGGAAGQTVTVSNQTDLERYATASEPYVIRVSGAITISPIGREIRVENSYFTNVNNPYYPDPAAQLRQTGSIVVGSRGRQETQGNAFTPSDFYSYTLDPAADVPSLVSANAGPQADIGQ